MRIKTKNDGRPQGCEWFAYASHLGAYPNCPDMNELYEMAVKIGRGEICHHK